MAIEFEGTTDPTGLEVYDSIEQRHLHVRTSTPVAPRTGDGERFCFPVDTTCTVETGALVFDQTYSVSLHNDAGRTEANLDVGETARLEDGTQFVGLSGPIRLYCRVEATGTIEVGLNSIRLSFDDVVPIELGARSLHERPVGTITTPADPEAMMEAIAVLSSALKTTTPERTWPTLRGHPPLIELGDEFEAPDAVERPDADVTIRVPPAYQSVFQVAPLAFYLGADVRPGVEPTLETPQFEYPLAGDDRLEDVVAGLLKRFFFLDCLVRTEGLFQYDLHERAVLEDALPFDLAETYAASLPEQLESYLEVPLESIEEYVPRWPLTAHVPAEPDSVELLPFVVNELGVVREPRGSSLDAVSNVTNPGASFVRSASARRSPSIAPSDDERAFVVPDVADESIEHAWFGDHVPQSASKATIEAYQNQLSRDSRSESIEILLVCNDARMLGEHDLLDDAYGKRESLPFDVHSEFGITTDRLAELLTDGGYDFLHYIGHATPDGLRCSDGDLDVRTLESVDVGVFFLNACQSYEQGLALVKRGAFGGVSTLRDVVNEQAVEIGETMARLLNLGFPLRAALEIAREQSALGEEYLIVGDGSTDIAQSEGGAPLLVELERREDDKFDFAVRSYPTKGFKIGTATESTLETITDRHITPNRTPFYCVSEESLQEYLIWTEIPIILDNRIYWNNGVGAVTID
ncbi:hypothetical protein ACFOZ7_01280 [Natribaculum luteum]|uniref:CHAT domain-containing protein n=1 Tax=Natribaculum luteum TaxID=1586232 RepID=A0ABD5NU93_9EURY|nr:hypothetical protein [Natribaculum luteum]